MKVNKTASHITIDQKAYLKTVLERFDMHNAKIAPTPIPSGYVPQENKGAVDPVRATKVSVSHQVFTVPHAWNASGNCLRG